jgi:thiol-disulfide isomerase/thioredoxin
MNGLLFLSSEDFTISKGTKGNILCTSIPGFSLILFYSTQCSHCQKLIPVFKRLPGSIGGCQFGMINVSSNKTCVQMSKDTVAPITYVPYIILFVNGRPLLRYNGPHDLVEIKRFVVEVAQKIQNKQKFSEKVVQDPRGGIPAYTIGHPLCGQDDVCYLEFDEAYMKEKQARAPHGGGTVKAQDFRQNLTQSAMNRRM